MNTSFPVPHDALNRVDAAVSSVTGWLNRACLDCDATVRVHPREAVLIAFAAGAMATRPPLNVMLGSGFKTAWTFAPTVLAIFGAFKLARHLGRLDEARPRRIATENETRLRSSDVLPSPITTEGALT